MIRVLLVDDHHLVRAGMTSLLDAEPDLTVVGEARDGSGAVAEATRCSPDVILMDLSMPVMDGVEATRAVLSAEPGSRVVVLTSFSDRDRVADAMAAGAIGYLLKDSEPADLLAAVRAAARGEVPLDPRVAGALLPQQRRDARGAERLSSREMQVLRLVARGLANKQIARSLGISERTVKAHLGSVFRALGVADRTSAALWARDHLDPDPGT
jgi:DNA-binding NarL/FixJ family response regulator